MDNFATEEDSKRAAKMFNSLVNNIAINIKGKNPVIHLSCSWWAPINRRCAGCWKNYIGQINIREPEFRTITNSIHT